MVRREASRERARSGEGLRLAKRPAKPLAALQPAAESVQPVQMIDSGADDENSGSDDERLLSMIDTTASPDA